MSGMTDETKWYCMRQNNSGGSFDHDAGAGIGPNVWIEARTCDEASARAQDIGLYFDGVRDGVDCGCCGDRWYEPDGYNCADRPEQYGQPVRPTKEGEDPTLDWGYPSYMHPLEGPFCTVVWESR